MDLSFKSGGKEKISRTVWACELASSGLKLKEPCLSFPFAVLLNVPASILLSCPLTRVGHDPRKA